MSIFSFFHDVFYTVSYRNYHFSNTLSFRLQNFSLNLVQSKNRKKLSYGGEFINSLPHNPQFVDCKFFESGPVKKKKMLFGKELTLFQTSPGFLRV